MSRISQFKLIKKHLEASRQKLIEKSDSYKYIDESVSDIAAYKAMKITRKLDQLSYLDQGLLQSSS